LLGARGDGLLNEHVLAGTDGVEGEPVVLGVWGCDVDDVDLRVGEKPLVCVVRNLDPVPLSEGAGSLQ
jgi:hypothetical protein